MENTTLPRIFKLVGLKLKVMTASGDSDKERLDILGDKVLGHIWLPTEDKIVFRIVVNLTSAKLKSCLLGGRRRSLLHQNPIGMPSV